MAYNSTTGIISQPVSIYDVQRCFGLSSPDLATLILNANINIWSEIKPIYSTKITQLTMDDRANPRSLSGFKTGCGVKKRAYVWADYIQGKDSSTGSVTSQLWTLDRPVVDGQCAFRLTDFAGYYHFVGRTFNIYTLFGNVNNILIPSSDFGDGSNITFSFGFTDPIADGGITAPRLFGDCWGFYPAVIITNGADGSNTYQYAKIADRPISAYGNSRVTIDIDTSEFARSIASDFRSLHSGDPYQSYPLRTGDRWTACMVLVSQQPVPDVHKISSSAMIVRLEYESGVDRRTLPIKQTKYLTIEWMKMSVTIEKVSGYTRRYRISSITITAKMLSTSSISFVIGALLSTPQGTVNVNNVASGQSVDVDNYSNVTFSGSIGEVTKPLSLTLTTYDVESTFVGNQLVNGTLTFKNTIGNFSGGFSFDVSGGAGTYTKENINLL